MPLYDYRCAACNNVTEIRHGFNDQAGPCPSCGGALERQFHAAPIIFNGSGFYVTDSRPSAAGSTPKPAETKTGGDAASPACGAGACSTKSDTAA